VRFGVGAGQAVHPDELGQPPDRGRDLLQPPNVLGVPAVLGVPYGLGQQLVAGLEVVDDQRWARAGALGHVGDPGVGVAALHDDVQRRPQHLLAPLPGVPRTPRLLLHRLIRLLVSLVGNRSSF
jgi:hypothetical protein